MDQVARSEWLSRLRSIRDDFGSAFDQVVPFGLERDGTGRVVGAVTAPLRRSVLTWFTGGAEESRRKNHRHFVDAMRQLVSSRLEHEIDAVHRSSRDLKGFERTLPGEVAAEVAVLRTELEHYLSLLHKSLLAYGERFERPDCSVALESFVPPVSPHVLFSRLTQDLTRIASELGRRWKPREEDLAAAAEDFVRPVPHPALPAAPSQVIERLWTASDSLQRIDLEAFNPGETSVSTIPAVEVAHFVPSQTAAARIVDAARAACERWLEECTTVVTTTAARTAHTRFQERFGCTPNVAGERMMELEDHYFRLQGFAVTVPAPHLNAAALSPSQLMWRTGDRDFVTRWNEAAVHAFVTRTFPEVGRRIQETIERHRDEQDEAWDGCKENLSSRLEDLLTADGKDDGRIVDALQLLPDHLRQPLQKCSSGLIVDEAAAEMLSLLLSAHSSFLLPRHACAPGSPGRAAVKIVENTVRDEAARLWGEPLGVSVDAARPRMLGHGLMASALFALTLCTGWLLLIGTGWLSIGLLAALTGVGACLQWHRVAWDAQQRVRLRVDRQVEQIRRRIPQVLDARAEHLRRFTGVLVRDAGFQRAVQDELMRRLAQEEPALPSFGEVIRRLRHGPALAVAA